MRYTRVQLLASNSSIGQFKVVGNKSAEVRKLVLYISSPANLGGCYAVGITSLVVFDFTYVHSFFSSLIFTLQCQIWHPLSFNVDVNSAYDFYETVYFYPVVILVVCFDFVDNICSAFFLYPWLASM